ncbi:MAG: selenide, water dikinase SelD [Candidatus Marinimicrobia bacterium]|nr:selenide, water dikinase SelD [Candidatus Neomarinimicrobiota bacterium]
MGDIALPTDDSVVVGFDGADDAAAVRLDDGKILVQSVDFFTPVVDDPYLFGQIAAANALSDIYAMGAKPLFALNIVGFPINDLPKKMLSTILQGGADKATEAGISIVGGHSIDDKEPKYGMVVTGEVDEENMWKNSTAKPGNILILTKPLGTGIISTAVKKGLASEESEQAAAQSMATLNKNAADALSKLTVHAVTDVTGFGLLGHLKEMCEASEVSAKIQFNQLHFLPGVRALAESGIVPGGTKRNLDYVSDFVFFAETLTKAEKWMIADAQTSGGLLISLPKSDADTFLTNFPNNAVNIGEIVTSQNALISVF